MFIHIEINFNYIFVKEILTNKVFFLGEEYELIPMLNLLKKFFCRVFLAIVPFLSFGDKVGLSSIEFRDLNAALALEDTLILDARPAVFYELGHIPNAVSLPLVNFEVSFDRINKEYNLKKFKQIIVYCSDRDCDDSVKLAKKL